MNLVYTLQSFITKKERWQAYFQGGLVQISEQDYNTIVTEQDVNVESLLLR